MTRRPRSHQLEDESRRAFAASVPSHWVIRGEHPDYGADFEIEVFEKEGAPTGLRFLVQVKATDRQTSGERTVRISRPTAEYLFNQDLPVLIVLFLSSTRAILYRWLHEYDAYYDRRSRSSIALRFGEANIWGADTVQRIQADLHRGRQLDCGGLPEPVVLNIAFAPPDEHHSGILAHTRRLLAEMPGLAAWTDDRDAAHYRVTATRDLTVADLMGRRFGALHGSVADLDPEGFAADILLLLAILLGQSGYAGRAAAIAKHVISRAPSVENPEIGVRLVQLLTKAHLWRDALELSEKLVRERGPGVASEFLRVPALVVADSLTPEERGDVRRYLHKRLCLAEAASDSRQRAIAHYNLANYLRSLQECREAVGHYAGARRDDPTYCQRWYFVAEYAGALFETKRFRTAAALYQAALGAGLPVTPLLADARMFNGEYAESLRLFRSHNKRNPRLEAEWQLKEWFLAHIVETLGSHRQRRQPSKAAHIFDDAAASMAQPERVHAAAVELDALCGLAWFNLAVHLHDIGHNADAATAFTMAALCQRWDVEAWANAFVLAFAEPAYRELAVQVLLAAYEAHGSVFVERCVGMVDTEHQPEFEVALRRALEAAPRRRGAATLRALGPGAEYTPISL